LLYGFLIFACLFIKIRKPTSYHFLKYATFSQ